MLISAVPKMAPQARFFNHNFIETFVDFYTCEVQQALGRSGLIIWNSAFS
jgi:hypothetical protein